MGCVIVEGDSLALFTAQMYYVDCQIGHCQQRIKYYNSREFLRKRRLKNERKMKGRDI